MREALLGGLVVLCLSAFLWPIAKNLIALWVRAYTWRLPPEVRARRRAEMESDVFEQSRSLREEGLRSAEIGLRLLWRVVCGVPADVSWAYGEWRRSPRRRVSLNAEVSSSATMSMQIYRPGTVEGDRLLRSIRDRMIHSPSSRDQGIDEFFLSNWDNISEVEVGAGHVILRMGQQLHPSDPEGSPPPA